MNADAGLRLRLNSPLMTLSFVLKGGPSARGLRPSFHASRPSAACRPVGRELMPLPMNKHGEPFSGPRSRLAERGQRGAIQATARPPCNRRRRGKLRAGEVEILGFMRLSFGIKSAENCRASVVSDYATTLPYARAHQGPSRGMFDIFVASELASPASIRLAATPQCFTTSSQTH